LPSSQKKTKLAIELLLKEHMDSCSQYVIKYKCLLPFQPEGTE